MDVHGGSGICKGPNNFISKFYEAGPIGITVEGSNVLTRSLIIFGQGLNKSHPHISDLVEAIQNNDKKEFYKNFRKMTKHFVGSFAKSSVTNLFSKAKSDPNSITSINFLSFLISWSDDKTNIMGSSSISNALIAASAIAGAVFFPNGSRSIE